MHSSEPTNQPPRGRENRKPYRKPEFRYERVFETMALVCGKTGTQGQCAKIPKKS
jgi:hypothetical protein